MTSEDIVRLAGTFTSPHVYPQALLHDQKVCCQIQIMSFVMGVGEMDIAPT